MKKSQKQGKKECTKSSGKRLYETPCLMIVGDIKELTKNIDQDGAGDSFFPVNLSQQS